MNVVLSIVTIVLLLVVVLALLGALREVSILQGKISALQDLLLKPPEPKFFDGMLPARAEAELRAASVGGSAPAFFLIFVRQACSGCAQLLEELKGALKADRVDPEQLVCVIAGAAGGLDARLRDSGFPVMMDQNRMLAEACQVKQTPTILHLDKTLKVLDAVVGGDIGWIYSRCQNPNDQQGRPKVIVRPSN